MECDPSDYLRQRGAAPVVVDGLGEAKVQGGLECHGFDVGDGVVPKLNLSVEQVLVGDAGECHGAMVASYCGVLLLYDI